jgi:hypothetical protein
MWICCGLEYVEQTGIGIDISDNLGIGIEPNRPSLVSTKMFNDNKSRTVEYRMKKTGSTFACRDLRIDHRVDKRKHCETQSAANPKRGGVTPGRHPYFQQVMQRALDGQTELHQYRNLERLKHGLPPLPHQQTTPLIPPPQHEIGQAPDEAARIHEKHYQRQQQLIAQRIFRDIGLPGEAEQKRNESYNYKLEDESTDEANPVAVLSKSKQVRANCIVMLIKLPAA